MPPIDKTAVNGSIRLRNFQCPFTDRALFASILKRFKQVLREIGGSAPGVVAIVR